MKIDWTEDKVTKLKLSIENFINNNEITNYDKVLDLLRQDLIKLAVDITNIVELEEIKDDEESNEELDNNDEEGPIDMWNN